MLNEIVAEKEKSTKFFWRILRTTGGKPDYKQRKYNLQSIEFPLLNKMITKKSQLEFLTLNFSKERQNALKFRKKIKFSEIKKKTQSFTEKVQFLRIFSIVKFFSVFPW